MMPWGGMMGWGGGGSGMVLGWLVMVAIVVAAVVAVAALRWLGWEERPGPGVGGHRALDTLRQRYARGEIGREEFEARKRDLQS